jgi:nitrogen fixation protein FixH
MTTTRGRGKAMDPVEPGGGLRLDGRHVALMCAAFFMVVAGVNGYMMRAAFTTFSGLEAENPYREGLAFNRRLEASRQQDKLGWRVDVALAGEAETGMAVALDLRDATGQAPAGVSGLVRLEWPADRRQDRTGELRDLGGGHFRAAIGPIAPGQWDVVVELERDGERAFTSRTRKILR